MPAPALTTERLILRPWRDSDLSHFAKLNADPQVMEYFPNLLTKMESDQVAQKIRTRLAEENFGFWAVEVRGIADFIGFTGLSRPAFTAHFTPCIEIGWRLARQYWGQGYVTEAANRILDFAFIDLDIPEITAFTVHTNQRSRNVMERINMQHDPAEDFDHPSLPDHHHLKRHVLYRISRANWLAR